MTPAVLTTKNFVILLKYFKEPRRKVQFERQWNIICQC